VIASLCSEICEFIR